MPRQLDRFSIFFTVLVLILASPSWADVSATVRETRCPVYVKQGRSWKTSRTKLPPKGAQVAGTLDATHNFEFRYASDPRNLYAAPARCFDLPLNTPTVTQSKAEPVSDVSGNSPWSVYLAPAYLTTSFVFAPAGPFGSTYPMTGKVYGAGLGISYLIETSSFLYGLSVAAGFGMAFAYDDVSKSSFSTTPTLYLLAPFEFYYKMGSAALGLGVGGQFVKASWYLTPQSSATITPTSRFSYYADFGYRQHWGRMILNPRIGYMDGGSLFGEFRFGFDL